MKNSQSTIDTFSRNKQHKNKSVEENNELCDNNFIFETSDNHSIEEKAYYIASFLKFEDKGCIIFEVGIIRIKMEIFHATFIQQ